MIRRRVIHRCLLVGLGRRAIDDHLPALIPSVNGIELVDACDALPDREELLDGYLARYPDQRRPAFYTDLESALDDLEPGFFIVATPHNTHLSIADKLVRRGIPFLKEKPFAINLAEARTLVELIERHQGHMRLCVQRHFHPLYVYGRKAIAHIGEFRHFKATDQLNADAYYVGWRSRPSTAGGGAVIDMGYHLIDLLHWYFGTPSSVYSTSAPKMLPAADYDVEETVLTSFTYENGAIGNLFLSLCEPHKAEELYVYGSTGYFALQRESLRRYDRSDTLIESLTRQPAWPSAVNDVFNDVVANFNNVDVVRNELTRGLEVMSIIECIYRSIDLRQSTSPRRMDTIL
jgi:predicted dehydrogenase